MPTTKKTVKKKAPAKKVAGPIRFTATLMKPAASEGAKGAWLFLVLPVAASKKLPSRSMVTVDGTMNGVSFVGTLEPDGKGGHWFRVEKALSTKAGARAGDEVTLSVAPMAKEPEPKVPPDLKKALSAAAPAAREAWADITAVARRDWIAWIVSGKKAETRVKRIEKACDMLASGKRRACCFDRSGMYDKSLSCPVAAEEEEDE